MYDPDFLASAVTLVGAGASLASTVIDISEATGIALSFQKAEYSYTEDEMDYSPEISAVPLPAAG